MNGVAMDVIGFFGTYWVWILFAVAGVVIIGSWLLDVRQESNAGRARTREIFQYALERAQTSETAKAHARWAEYERLEREQRALRAELRRREVMQKIRRGRRAKFVRVK